MGSAGGNGGNPTPAAAAPPPLSIMEFLHGPSWVRRVRIRTAGAEASSSASSSSPAAGSAGSMAQQLGDDEEERWLELTLAPPLPRAWSPRLPAAAARAWPVAFGFMGPQPDGPLAIAPADPPLRRACVSTLGRLPYMEDSVSLRPGFHTWVDGSPMQFFAVFDGHGGTHVRIHTAIDSSCYGPPNFPGRPCLVRRELATAGVVGTSSSVGAWVEHHEEEHAWRAALARAFGRVDAMAAIPCACGRIARPPPCECPRSVFTGYVGSTAVVALLVRGTVVVANCGDSRAVLCRGLAGVPPIPLSYDHKPNRPDELARIHAVGGQVMYKRVRGVLAMTRALGDRKLRPEVIAEPEITITERTANDQCLILASDGMWDVISNETACHVARQCLEYGNSPPVDPRAANSSTAAAAMAAAARGQHGAEPRCSRAAWVLGRLALARETADNISVIVVDLRQRER
ncbi:unnamed protein product [Urochloa decumbens]|uniref:protein-serine/threonine phosphatase n=1 Tax=Urochloa decumbens TaxID=240449 RepID=A0ABC9CZ78_9POAL